MDNEFATADDGFWRRLFSGWGILTDYHYLYAVLVFAHVADVADASGAGVRPLSREPCRAEVRSRWDWTKRSASTATIGF